jgi:L-amino acid N-acyltransferase YncA
MSDHSTRRFLQKNQYTSGLMVYFKFAYDRLSRIVTSLISKNALMKVSFTLKTLSSTVKYEYGEGLMAYVKFIYYSFFKINRFLVFENDLTRELVSLDVDPEFQVVKPTIDELDRFRKDKSLPREFYYDKIHNAQVCYLVMQEMELAYIHWIFFMGDYSRFLILSDNVVELNYNTTVHRFRGRRLSAKMMAFICRDLKELGYQKAMGVIHEKNIASIKCILQAGFRETTQIKALGPFNRRLKC